MSRLTLDTDRQVFFYEQEFYVLSNFSSFKVEWNGILHDTAEHAYHWYKFENTHKEVAESIRTAISAHEAFTLGQTYKVWRRPDWDEVKVDVMRSILMKKVRQHEYVYRKLMETGNRQLVENSWRDDYWGWGENQNGKNMLGQLWMEIRQMHQRR